MRRAKLVGIGLLALAALAAAGCTGNDVDDGDSADILLQILSLDNPAITEGGGAGACSVTGAPCLDSGDCDPADPTDVCVFADACVITEWSATLANEAKSELSGGSPFNDVFMEGVTIEYAWANGFAMAPLTVPLASTIVAGSTGQAQFFPITGEDLAALRAAFPAQSRSANVTVTFRGRIAGGEVATVSAGSQLFVEACP